MGKIEGAARVRLEQVTVARLSWNVGADRYGRDTRAMLAVHGMDPDGPVPGIEEFRARKHAEDAPLFLEAVRAAVVYRTPLRMPVRVWPDSGGQRVLMILAEPVMVGEFGLVLDGYFADVTPFAQEQGLGLDGMRERVGQLRQAQQRREVIEQAKGAIMELFHCDADMAWRVLRGSSQQLNLKVGLVAEQFVAWLTSRDGQGGDWGHIAAMVQVAGRDLGLSMSARH